MTHSWTGGEGRRETTYDDRADDVRAPGWEEAVAASAAAGVLVPSDTPLAPEEVTGNLRRYARWQWKDFWQRRGFWLAGAALFGVWMLVHWMLADRLVGGPDGGPMFSRPPQPDEVFGISHAAFAVGGVLAGLLGAGGLVARERERGLQRFLFAKPVNIVRYYLQGFTINAVGSLLVLVGAILLAAATAGPALAVGSLVVAAAGGWVLGAGVTFLLSTLVRFDAPAAGAWLMAGFPVVALAANGYWWAQALQWLFPHGWAYQVAMAVFGPRAVGISPELMVALAACIGVVYGLLCLAGGVAVLRRRSIAT